MCVAVVIPVLETPHPASGAVARRVVAPGSWVNRYLPVAPTLLLVGSMLVDETAPPSGGAAGLGQAVTVEVVYRYRALLGKCDLGLGLDWDEIELVTMIEATFAPSSDDRRMKTGRRFRRERVALPALIRGDRINDRIEVCELGPGGLVAQAAPFIAHGERVEIVIELADRSYRFAADGVWMKDDVTDYRVGLRFVGIPVCLHRGTPGEKTDVLERISAAA